MNDEAPATLERYFLLLDGSDPSTAAEAFAESAILSLAGTEANPGRKRYEGRAAIEGFFVDRGSLPTRHVLTRWCGDRAGGLAEGVIVDNDDCTIASFVISLDFDHDGLIRRYVGYNSFPAAG